MPIEHVVEKFDCDGPTRRIATGALCTLGAAAAGLAIFVLSLKLPLSPSDIAHSAGLGSVVGLVASAPVWYVGRSSRIGRWAWITLVGTIVCVLIAAGIVALHVVRTFAP